MSFPTLKELQLQMEVDQLRAELHRAHSKNITITRDYLNQDMTVHDNGHYSLNPFMEVRGYSATERGENFIARWKQTTEIGYHEILYKADFVSLTPDAANHILEDMLKNCLYHIIQSQMPRT